MKKKLLSIILGISMVICMIPTYSFAADIAINSTTFPDKIFRNIISNDYDSNKDGKLSSTEISKITEIDMNSKGVTSLKGIEYLTVIETLNCSYNYDIDTLDISKNVNLTYLDCADDNISTLDLSKNRKLTYLDCWHNYDLNTLDISKNVNLTYLDCSSNDLSTLDVSKNVNLIKLHCSDNNLSTLDVSKNVNLIDLYCSDNNLSTLDVSKNVDLDALDCSNNDFSKLDFSSNKLGWLECSYCKNLSEIIFNSNNSLRCLLSRNCSLAYMDLGYDGTCSAAEYYFDGQKISQEVSYDKKSKKCCVDLNSVVGDVSKVFVDENDDYSYDKTTGLITINNTDITSVKYYYNNYSLTTDSKKMDVTVALNYGNADYSAVDTAIAKVPADLSIYTDESVATLNSAINAVDRTKNITEQDTVNGYETAINTAISNLEYKYKGADYTEVDKALAKVPTDLSIYTDESITTLNSAINAVDRSKNTAQQDIVDGYATAINNAINNLVYKDADYTAVDRAIENVPTDLSVYTKSSVNELNNAITAVDRTKKANEQSTVDNYAADINDAISKLLLIGPYSVKFEFMNEEIANGAEIAIYRAENSSSKPEKDPYITGTTKSGTVILPIENGFNYFKILSLEDKYANYTCDDFISFQVKNSEYNNATFIFQVDIEKTYSSILFNSNGGTEVAEINKLKNVPDSLPSPTKEGFNFAGWYTDSTFETPVALGSVLEDDTTLYAKWNCDHTSTHFEANSGQHNEICNKCNETVSTENCTFINGICSECGCVDLASCDVITSIEEDYSGEEIKPEISVSLNGNDINSDLYSVSYSNNTEPGIAKITVSSNSKNSANSKDVYFTINKLPQLPELEINDIIFGEKVDPQITGSKTENNLITFSYYDLDNNLIDGVPMAAGTYTVVANIPECNYYLPATATKSFSIKEKDISGFNMTIDINKYPNENFISVNDNDTELLKDIDYSYETYEKNGYLYVTVSGIGNYSGEIENSIKLPEKAITEKTVTEKETVTKKDSKKLSPNTGFDVFSGSTIILLLISLFIIIKNRLGK